MSESTEQALAQMPEYTPTIKTACDFETITFPLGGEHNYNMEALVPNKMFNNDDYVRILLRGMNMHRFNGIFSIYGKYICTAAQAKKFLEYDFTLAKLFQNHGACGVYDNYSESRPYDIGHTTWYFNSHIAPTVLKWLHKTGKLPREMTVKEFYDTYEEFATPEYDVMPIIMINDFIYWEKQNEELSWTKPEQAAKFRKKLHSVFDSINNGDTSILLERTSINNFKRFIDIFGKDNNVILPSALQAWDLVMSQLDAKSQTYKLKPAILREVPAQQPEPVPEPQQNEQEKDIQQESIENPSAQAEVPQPKENSEQKQELNQAEVENPSEQAEVPQPEENPEQKPKNQKLNQAEKEVKKQASQPGRKPNDFLRRADKWLERNFDFCQPEEKPEQKPKNQKLNQAEKEVKEQASQPGGKPNDFLQRADKWLERNFDF